MIFKRLLLLYLIGTFQVSVCFSQTNSDSIKITYSNKKSNFFSPFVRIGKDLLIQATSPFHMSKENAYWFGAGLLTTAALIASDQGTYNTVRDVLYEDTKFTHNMSPTITQFGSYYGLAVLGAFAGYSFIFNNSKAKETSFLAAESFLTSGIWTIAAKMLTGRERPSAKNHFADAPGGKWFGPFALFTNRKGRTASSYDAFPSGHTATAFSIATVFAYQYNHTLIVPIISYGLAGMVGISRIMQDTHWASDVFVGAVLGYLSSVEIMQNNPSELSRKEKFRKMLSSVQKIRKRINFGINPFQKSLNLSYTLF